MASNNNNTEPCICTSDDNCPLGRIIAGAPQHRCRECRKPMHSLLCSAIQELGDVQIFICFPCHQSRDTRDDDESTTITSTTNDRRVSISRSTTAASSSSSNNNNHNTQQTTGTTRRRQTNNNRTPAAGHPQNSRLNIPPTSNNNNNNNNTPIHRQNPLLMHLETPLFFRGDLVKIDSPARSYGGTAFIDQIGHTPGGSAAYSAKYVLDRKVSPNVKLTRIHPTTLNTSSHHRSGSNDGAAQGPSLLSSNYVPSQLTTTSEATNKGPETTTPVQNKCTKQPHPIIKYLHDKKIKKKDQFAKGYLRRLQAKAEKRKPPKEKAYLSAYEWDLVLKMRESMDCAGVECMSGPNSSGRTLFLDLANVWGITHQGLNSKRRKVLKTTNLATTRQKRSDAGETVFNSERKRQQTFTPYQAFKKHKLKHSTLQDALTTAEIKQEWAIVVKAPNKL